LDIFQLELTHIKYEWVKTKERRAIS